MKTIIERIETEIIDRIKSLQIHLDDELILCEMTTSEQEKIVENIKQELKRLEMLYCKIYTKRLVGKRLKRHKNTKMKWIELKGLKEWRSFN